MSASAYICEPCPQCAELRARLAQAEADALSLALRLYGEPETSLAPESHAAMQRWRPKCDALLRGEP